MICVHYTAFSSCKFLYFVDRLHFGLAKVFFVALRGPSWIKKGFLPRPSRTDQTKILQRFSSWPFAALRGQKRFSPPPFADRPNQDLAKVFFVALRGPSWIKKRCSPRTFVDRPHFDLANFSSNIRQRDLVDSDPFSELEATPPAVAASPPTSARPDPPVCDPPV